MNMLTKNIWKDTERYIILEKFAECWLKPLYETQKYINQRDIPLPEYVIYKNKHGIVRVLKSTKDVWYFFLFS